MKSKKKILICVPSNNFGGVANYYSCLRPFLNEDYEYLPIGLNNPQKISLISLIKSIKSFYNALNKKRYKIVIINPSLDYKSLIRDTILSFISKFFGLKTIIFFRGLDINYISLIKKIPIIIYPIIINANVIISLSFLWKSTLIKLGVKKPIYNETTTYSIKINKLIKSSSKNPQNILFMSRLEKSKGLYETIELYKILREKNKKVNLYICGDGSEKDNISKISTCDSNIKFYGYVSGDEKIKILSESDIFVLPSDSEGMPNVVLEAMAVGLPILTRPVGGIKDFFLNGEHGFITKSKSPEVFATYIERLIDDKKLYNYISLNNKAFAKGKFSPEVVAKRIENIVNKTLIN